MFGIPTDPRLVEVLGWLLYAVPVLIVFLWPTRLAPKPVAKRRILVCTAAGLAATAVAMAVFIPAGADGSPGPTRSGHHRGRPAHDRHGRHRRRRRASCASRPPAAVIGRSDSTTRASRSIDGVDVTVWQAKVPADPGVTTNPISLGELAHLTGGRLPVGLGNARTPGPFDATVERQHRLHRAGPRRGRRCGRGRQHPGGDAAVAAA